MNAQERNQTESDTPTLETLRLWRSQLTRPPYRTQAAQPSPAPHTQPYNLGWVSSHVIGYRVRLSTYRGFFLKKIDTV